MCTIKKSSVDFIARKLIGLFNFTKIEVWHRRSTVGRRKPQSKRSVKNKQKSKLQKYGA